ncbi:hypothetical protein LXA43DRAFT_1068914 [Ganoderma leucocontextum]|nr:hypothetical protein LXA43DRAFT_1068914 [Ganoderma leucocontextum]
MKTEMGAGGTRTAQKWTVTQVLTWLDSGNRPLVAAVVEVAVLVGTGRWTTRARWLWLRGDGMCPGRGARAPWIVIPADVAQTLSETVEATITTSEGLVALDAPQNKQIVPDAKFDLLDNDSENADDVYSTGDLLKVLEDGGSGSGRNTDTGARSDGLYTTQGRREPTAGRDTRLTTEADKAVGSYVYSGQTGVLARRTGAAAIGDGLEREQEQAESKCGDPGKEE